MVVVVVVVAAKVGASFGGYGLPGAESVIETADIRGPAAHPES